MSQLSKIPASAYTPEMETLGVLPDIPTFYGEPVSVSRNPLTSGTRPLQLLPLPSTEFPMRYETSWMRGFQAELRHARRSCMTQLFLSEQLRDAAVRGARQSLEQLRDAATEMRGAVVEMRGAGVELRDAGTEVRDAAVLQGAQLGRAALRDAATEMRGAVVEMRGAGVELRDAGTEVRDAAVLQGAQLGRAALRDAATVDLGKARSGGSSTDASAFWDLLDPSMRARVVAAGFGDYAAGLRRTQPRFPPTMRYALMERWNDCTHTFVFGFGEMTLTPVDYAAIMGLHFCEPLPKHQCI
ncbi:hypothetical protein JCGZ_03639 [Jatropha curcas]|uniref:Aminotransferase-like plant mobile domain-containing protein n=1 Tax=Jatropha curcas TaxID=180498 RepID=A0A067JQD4_JATCU|nr:hypothetical protein JCGZ_03639 [Jatropha curcas]